MRYVLTIIQIFVQIVFLLAAANMAAHAGDQFSLVRESLLKMRNSASVETLSMIRGSATPALGAKFSSAGPGNYTWMYH